jgi:alpha-amylase
MGVLLQATYRRRQGVSVPAPSDGDPNTPWWWDHIASQANALRQAGFTAVLLPPVLKTSAGAYPGGDGYGPFDDYDIGSKQQFFTVPTRFGSREKLQRCVAMLRANGLDVYVDTVPHHRNGGNDFEYRYRGANGTPAEGRFPKHKTCFVPNVPRDPIAGPVRDDFGFGDELAPINAKPPGYVLNGLIDAGDWLTRALDVQGYRIDDVKGLAVEFVRRWLTSKAMVGKFAVGEYFDANPQTLRWWAWDSGMAGRSSVFDFALRFALAAMCNNSSRWDMTQLDHAGLTGHAPLNAVTFVDNPDTDLSSPVVWNKLLGYAYILTAEGYPCVYYKDYATDSGCYGLRRWIDNLIWIHENLAFGPTVTRFKDYQTIVYERQGYPNLLVGLNNDQYHGWRTITAQTGFGGNVQLHDYTGNGRDIWTDAAGNAVIGIPPNENGHGYVAYSRVGYTRPFAAVPLHVSQVVQGAADLDIGPAANGMRKQVNRVWCAARTMLSVNCVPHVAGWQPTTEVVVDVVGPDGATLGTQNWTGVSPAPGAIHVEVARSGWHSVRLTAAQLPEPGTTPFAMTISYLSTQTFGGD